jgi:hypothetical protein
MRVTVVLPFQFFSKTLHLLHCWLVPAVDRLVDTSIVLKHVRRPRKRLNACGAYVEWAVVY